MCARVCKHAVLHRGLGRELSRWECSGGLQGAGVLEEPMTGSAEGVE